MSWLARSLANSFGLDAVADAEDDDADSGFGDPHPNRTGTTADQAPDDGSESPSGSHSPTRGVKEDLSELTKTLTSQLWGVASFLAPPPQSPDIHTSREESERDLPGTDASDLRDGKGEGGAEGADSPRMAGIRSDFAEIGGRFRSGISKLSGNKAVAEISKLASTFLPFGSEGDEEEEEEEEEEEKYYGGEAVGVTEEVLAFARNISMHPETWLDFPLLPEEEESDDFDMSDAQQEHALAVEHLAPRLAALRIELCPSHMSEECFWKIYFVLIHPRLNKEDAERLSTPQIVEARTMLLQELQSRTKSESFLSERSSSYRKDPTSPISSGEHLLTTGDSHDNMGYKTSVREEIPDYSPKIETEKHLVTSSEMKIVDKSVVQEELPNQLKRAVNDSSEVPVQKFEDDGDDWLQDDATQVGGPRVISVPLENEEDVSFSDLEDEDDETTHARSKVGTLSSVSQNKDSREWVQLRNSSTEFPKDGRSSSPETKESSDWLDVDEDIDLV